MSVAADESKLPELPERLDHVHFVAIGGTGMGALAGLLKARGIRVTGSDKKLYPPMSTALADWGIDVGLGFAASNVLERRPDLVVIGNAVRADNPEAVVLLVLENLTGHDLSIGFEIDGAPDGALVFNGESLVIEFDCFETVALVFEDRFDPQTGLFIEGFDLLDAQVSRPTDFSCGEAVIFTLEESEILISTEPVREAS